MPTAPKAKPEAKPKKKTPRTSDASTIAVDPVRSGWKVFTSDLCPPVQGGDPVWGGNLPATLPTVALDRSSEECSHGWNYCDELSKALRIAGLWSNGRPSRAFLVEAAADAIERGDKRRASSLTLLREATEVEIEAAIVQLSAPFGQFTAGIVAEQMAWRAALARPRRDRAEIEKKLELALATRALPWTLKEFPTARDAWAARDARDAWDAWDARDAWAAWAAWDAWAAWAARDAWAAWAARAARAARDARAALTWWYAASQQWVAGDPAKYAIGVRDAYANGCAIALPTGPNELGWAMDDTRVTDL